MQALCAEALLRGDVPVVSDVDRVIGENPADHAAILTRVLDEAPGACVVTMDAAKAVTATFTINSYDLTVATVGMGTVTAPQIACPGDCTGTFTHGTAVTLVPTAGTGYTFTGWSGACSGTGACVGNADTAGVSLGYFITDNIAAEAELGIPPKFDLSGSGSLSPLGKIGEARMWAPAVLLKYYFNKADSKFRPYLGVGATYVWFTGDSITNQTLTQNIGLIGTRPLAPLGLAGPGVQTSVSTTNSWAPVFSAGFNYNFTKHWFAGFSLSYIPVNVTANLDTTNTAGVHVRSEAKIHLNPIVTYLKVGYAF